MQTKVRLLSRVTSGKDRKTFLYFLLTCSNRCKRRLDVALDCLSILTELRHLESWLLPGLEGGRRSPESERLE